MTVESAKERQCFLIVERKENWLVDRNSGFTEFGLADRYRRAAERIRKGDLLLSYVSGGISAFADIRECTKDGYQPLRFGGDYDTAFPIKLMTRSIAALEPDDWVKVHDIVSRLSFTADKTDWRQSFRHSIRELSKSDAEIVQRCILDRVKSKQAPNKAVR